MYGEPLCQIPSVVATRQGMGFQPPIFEVIQGIAYCKGFPMSSAQVISLSEVRASNQWQRLRDDLHTRFDQWLDRLQEQLPNPQTRLGIAPK